MRPTPLKRSLTRFFDQPVSVRNAMRVIVAATLVSVFVGGILIRVVEPENYSNIGVGLWWSIQTVTTVGYGDVTPKTPIGRFVGAVIMLQSISFVTVVTATIASSFIERVQRERRTQELANDLDDEQHLHARFDELLTRLDRLERTIDSSRNRDRRQP